MKARPVYLIAGLLVLLCAAFVILDCGARLLGLASPFTHADGGAQPLTARLWLLPGFACGLVVLFAAVRSRRANFGHSPGTGSLVAGIVLIALGLATTVLGLAGGLILSALHDLSQQMQPLPGTPASSGGEAVLVWLIPEVVCALATALIGLRLVRKKGVVASAAQA